MMLAVLARASLEGAIVAALVWTVIRWLPRLSPATRTALWWCAAAKFLLALVWVTPVELRVLPPRAETPGAVSRLAAAATGPIESSTESAGEPRYRWAGKRRRCQLAGHRPRSLGRRPRLGRVRRSAPADADAPCHAAFQPGDGADCRDGGRARRRHRTSPHARGVHVQRDDHSAGRRSPAAAHSPARQRRRRAVRRRRTDGALPRAVARQTCGSLAGAGARGSRASLLLSSARAAGVARVSAVPGSGVRRGCSRHAGDDPAGLRPAAPGARRVAASLEPRRRRRLIVLFDAQTEDCHASRFVAIDSSADGRSRFS